MRRGWHRIRVIVAGIVGWAVAAPGADSIRLNPGSFTAGPDSPPAQAAPEGGVFFPLPWDGPTERCYWDVPMAPPDAASPTVAVELSCDNPAAVKALSLHVRCGDGWLSTSAPIPGAGRQTLYFQRADFAPEGGGAPDWKDANTLRLSAWKAASTPAHLIVHSIRMQGQAVAILRASERSAPGETALAAQCASRAQRLLEKAGIPASILSDDLEDRGLRPFRLVVLPYNPVLSITQLDALDRYLRRGGRLAVFYQGNTRLARMLGFKADAFATQEEEWTTVSFAGSSIPALPATMPHLTRNLLPVRADAADSVTMGAWKTDGGAPNPRLPAAAASPRGFWFSHVPPLAYPSAVKWLLACDAFSDPARQPALRLFEDLSARRNAEAADLRKETHAPAGEIRAVWAPPIPSRVRDTTLRELSARGINAVFEQVATLGDDLPSNRLLQQRIERAVKSAHERGLRLHAWFVTLNAESWIDRLPAERRMLTAGGQALPWLCPLHPENRAMIHSAWAELVRLGVDGIHLDYIRYPGTEGCYCPLHREAFEKRIGQRLANWPADAAPGGPRGAEYETFRREALTDFVAIEMRALRTQAPAVQRSAAVFPSPESAAENGQDWPAWLRDGLFDFVAPMIYTEDPVKYAAAVDHARAAAPSPALIVAGIGTGSDISQLDALGTGQQIQVTRERHLAGFALFRLDSDLFSVALPLRPQH